MAVSKEEIEKIIETKFNQFIKEVPNLKRDIKKEIEIEDDFFNFSIKNTYQNTIQTIIDIINDMIMILDNSNNYNYKNYLKIFFAENRMFYIGIILILFSFIIYFIDGATI
jgi:hypothetical protein